MCYFRVKVNSKNVYRGQKTTSEISEIPEAEVDGATRDTEPVTDQTRPRRRRRRAVQTTRHAAGCDHDGQMSSSTAS